MARRAARVINLDWLWRVHKGGYRWEDCHEVAADGARRLHLAPANYSQGVRHYKPLHDNTGLFWKFARLDATEANVLQFANEFGALFEPLGWHGRPGEELLDWQREVRDLGTAVSLWQLAREGDRTGLSERIVWREDPAGEMHVYFYPSPECPPEEQQEIASHRHHKHLIDRFHQDDPAGPAVHYARLLANARIERHVIYTLNDTGGDNPLKAFKGQLEPKDLCGALWLQLTQAVNGNKEFLQCPGCHNWFEVSSGRFRRDKTVCSPACRARVYRSRAAKAKELRSKGKSVQAIAEAVEATQKQVKKWLSTSKQGVRKHVTKAPRKG